MTLSLIALSMCASGATLAQDGMIRGIDFSENDHYCLDGQRLIPIVGTNGSVGALYRTELDGYSEVISVGGSANE